MFIRSGEVNANGRAQREGYNLFYSNFYSNETLRGMTGGVVLNDNGELVAIHGKRDEQGENEKSQAKVLTGGCITIYWALRQMGKVGLMWE
ncbi:hypothetical protein [Calothrix sp. PCC 6303]|uniref:hypothetical protein n=1 Tax=Calothrix sp. PCC 6303 TaxID=1170562 RepID=UPI00031B07F0|nr:hypothetical protein [Calothrix sp. PCC 6303]